jgi:hypothetical protein
LAELEAEHYKTTLNLHDAITLASDQVPALNAKLGFLDSQHERAKEELDSLEEPGDE